MRIVAAAVVLAQLLTGCASLETMYPEERAGEDLKQVERDKHFELAKPVAFKPRNRHNTLILADGRTTGCGRAQQTTTTRANHGKSN